jgi:hypothetical protein
MLPSGFEIEQSFPSSLFEDKWNIDFTSETADWEQAL